MRKIFLLTTLILTLFTATAFAEDEANPTDTAYDYTSETYGFRILCPAKPIVVVNPFENPNDRGELLVFANDGIKILYGYQIKLNAFADKQIPNFNKDKPKVIDNYIAKLRESNAYEEVALVRITKDNSGVMAVTAKEIEVKDENGEVEGVLVADTQSAITFFRTPSGDCISLQLLADELNEENRDNYLKSLVSFTYDNDKKDSKKKKSGKKSKS